MFNVLYVAYDAPPDNIQQHIEIWKKIPEETRKQMRFIIVDDCSPTPVTADVDYPINLTIARITTDIYWNTSGAKNLGFAIADNDWVFTSDIDHTADPEEFVKMVKWPKVRKNVYMFQRHMPDGSFKGRNTSNIFIIHKEDFWRTGGYDEDMAGAYGHDEVMTIGDPRRPEKNSMMKILGYQFISTNMKITEWQKYQCGKKDVKYATASTNLAKIQKKQRLFAEGKYRNGPILRFNWTIASDYKYENMSRIFASSTPSTA